MTKKNKNLNLAIDLGSSLTKIKFQFSGSETYHETIQPEIIGIDYKAIDLHDTYGNNNIFIGVNDSYYAIGNLAVEDFKSSVNLLDPKSNYAIPKILAAVYLAARRVANSSSLTANAKTRSGANFSLNLRILLPPGEMKDSDSIEKRLLESFDGFDTPLGVFKIQLNSINFDPEGAGLAKYYLKHRGDCEDRSIATIMLGHRNASTFRIKNGNFGKFRTSDLGFSFLVQNILDRTSGYKTSIAGKIAKYLLSSNVEDLNSILLNKQSDFRVEELSRLIDAVEASKKIYTAALLQWIESQISGADEIILGGGTAPIFEDDIFDRLEPQLTEVPKQGVKAFLVQGGWKYPTDSDLSTDLRDRFADLSCLWNYYF